MNEYLSRVTDFLKGFAEDDLGEITEDTQLIADLGFNSLEMMQIINDAEMEFDIEITDEELETIVTVGDFIAVLKEKE